MKAPSKINGIEDTEFLQIIESTGDAEFDFSELEFIRPVGVVALLATLERLADQLDGWSGNLILPDKPEVREYLRTAGVFDIMRKHITFSDLQPEDFIPEIPPERPMVPCTYFETDSEIEEIANRMQEDFETVLPGRSTLFWTCHTAFSELANNVIHHAESGGGYVLAQKYCFSDGPRVEIAVADCGIGIQASLRKNQKFTDRLSDEDAIELAIKEGVSSLEDKYRGYGLFYVTDDVKSSANRQLIIRSGYGTMILRGNDSIIKCKSSSRYAGTILNVTIPC